MSAVICFLLDSYVHCSGSPPLWASENAGQLFVAMVILLFTLCFIVDETSSKSQDVHAPAANLTELKKTAALREKMAAIREKRRVNAILG